MFSEDCRGSIELRDTRDCFDHTIVKAPARPSVIFDVKFLNRLQPFIDAVVIPEKSSFAHDCYEHADILILVFVFFTSHRYHG